MKQVEILLLIVTLGLSTTITAQTHLDSLYAVWQDGSQSDSDRTVAYRDYVSKGILDSDPDSALILADVLIEFGKDRNNLAAQASALRLKGEASSQKSDHLQALDYLDEALKIDEQLGDQEGISLSLHYIGVVYKDQGDLPKALKYYTRSLKIREQLGDQDGIANSLTRIGYVYGLQEDYPKALDHYTRSVEIKEQLGDQDGIANSLQWIGYIYYQVGDFTKALDHYNQSLKISEQLGDQYGIAAALYGIGIVYKSQGALDKALDCQTQSLNIHEQLEGQRGISGSLNAIGAIYEEQGDLTKALEYYIRSLKIREELADPRRIPLALNYVGKLYLLKSDHANALEYCHKSYQLASSIRMLESQIVACECLYDTYRAIGNGNRALEYLELKVVLDDSLKVEETEKKIQQMEFAKQILQDSIAAAEKERLVQESHKTKLDAEERSRNISRAIGAFFILLAGGLYNRVRYMRKSRSKLQDEKDRSEDLLLNILPAEIAEELKEKGEAVARDFDMVSILFTDFKGFTQASEKLSAADLVAEINNCFKAFDGIVGKYNIEKIKTIGDAYMCAGGLPVPDENAVTNTVHAGLEMQAFMKARKSERDAAGLPAFEMRVGIHTGPVVAGIVGVKKFQYDIWGDTVNTASRMESSGEVGQVNISEATYDLVKENSVFDITSRGKIEAKGKGEMEMYFVILSASAVIPNFPTL